MAEAGMSVSEEQFTCPICLDLLKEPVSIPCGHSYCRGCLGGYWDQDDHFGAYSCPQCRQTFSPRPALSRNTILADMVETLRKRRVQAASAPQGREPADVVCDVCTGRKRKAVKSCLVCLASHCETHIKLHNMLNRGKRHKLIDATGQLQICPHHDKLLEVYCRTDQQCVCYLCTMDEHKGHDTVSAAAGRTDIQKQLDACQQESQQKIQGREKEIEELRQALDSFSRSAQAAVEHSESIFSDLVRSIEKRRAQVKDLIRAQERTVRNQTQALVDRLEQEINEMRRRDAELEQLKHTEDDIHFLQSCKSLCVSPVSADIPSVTVTALCSFEDVQKAVTDLKQHVEQASKTKILQIYQNVKALHTLQTSQRRSRDQYLCRVS